MNLSPESRHNSRTIRNFYDVIYPFNNFAKVLGYLSFTLLDGGGGQKPSTIDDDLVAINVQIYRTTWLDLLCFVLNIGVNLLFLYQQATMELLVLHSMIVVIGVKIVHTYSMCVTLCSLLIVWRRRQRVVEAIRKMDIIDQEVSFKYIEQNKIIYVHIFLI